MTSSVRSVKMDNVNRLIEAVRSWGAFDMEKMLRRHPTSQDTSLKRTGATDPLAGREFR